MPAVSAEARGPTWAFADGPSQSARVEHAPKLLVDEVLGAQALAHSRGIGRTGSITRFFSGFRGLEVAREGDRARVLDGPQGGLR